VLRFIFSILIVLLSPVSAFASIDFLFTTGDAVTGVQTLAADSNNCPVDGPIAAYVAGTITNSGATTVSDIVADLTGLTGGFALTGTQTGTVQIGSLAPGTTIMVGWHITYPCDTSKKNAPGPSTAATVTLTDGNGGNTSTALTLFSRKAISANAGGNVLSTVLGAGAIVGQTITADVMYDFGGNSLNDEFFTQPAGNTDFDAACLQLVGAEVLTSNITAAPAGTLNTLYFVSPTSQSGNNYFIEMRYYYKYLCANTVSTARPYAVQTSGNTNIKYTGNYDGGGALVFNFPTSTNPFIVTKTANVSTFFAGNGPHVVTYTVAIENPSVYDSLLDRFVDILPNNTSFQGLDAASDITIANSGSVPSVGATGTITFAGLNSSSYAIAAGQTLNLIYQAEIPDVNGDYTNDASVLIGPTTLDTDTSTVTVGTAEISASKSIAMYDPNGDGLYAVPGNEVVYTFTIENTGSFDVDDGTIILVDPLPDNVTFYNGDFDPANIGMGPFDFNAGGSAITCCGTGEIDYSDSTSAPITYGYSPASGFDPALTYLKLTPSNILEPGESVTVSFRARIN